MGAVHPKTFFHYIVANTNVTYHHQGAPRLSAGTGSFFDTHQACHWLKGISAPSCTSFLSDDPHGLYISAKPLRG